MSASFRLLLPMVLAALLVGLFPAGAAAQRVALVAADTNRAAQDVQSKLLSAGVTDVTIINVAYGLTFPPPPTPTLTELAAYDVVLTWSNYGYADPVGLGNVLADYVDLGGGVVQAVFALSSSSPMRLEGRWRTGQYDAFSSGAFQTGYLLSLIATIPDHPILSGVTTFSGGYASYHHRQMLAQGCGEVVARWSNGEPLVAARRGPVAGRVVGLNFYPPSNESGNANGWTVATDGEILMANALRYAAEPEPLSTSSGPAVALLAAEAPSPVAALRCQLQNTSLFSRVDAIDVRLSTPSLSALLEYDAVLTWSNAAYADPTSLGNVLADYVDLDRGVVQSIFRTYPSAGASLDGRWLSGGYRAFGAAPAASASGLAPIPMVPAHVLLAGIDDLAGDSSSVYARPVSLDAPTTVVAATWSDAEPFLTARLAASGGRIVGLNLFPAARDAQVIANTLLFAANHWPTADAGADQSVEATGPAGASFTLSAAGSDPDGDTLTFSWSGAVSADGSTLTIDVPPPAAPATSATYDVTLTVGDGKGGEATDIVTLTVTDTTAPVLDGVPTATVTAEAPSGSGGVEVAYGPVTATDAVDGVVPVTCSPSGVFPIGDTVVTCSANDSRGNSASAAFTVSVSESVPEPEHEDHLPGRMEGAGFIRENGERYDFQFAVSESTSGVERVRLFLRSRSGSFVARSMVSCTFGERTVLFSGTGNWKGAAGYAYTVFASDNVESGDAIRLTVTDPGGKVVANVGGALSGGNIRSHRLLTRAMVLKKAELKKAALKAELKARIESKGKAAPNAKTELKSIVEPSAKAVLTPKSEKAKAEEPKSKDDPKPKQDAQFKSELKSKPDAKSK